jgi:hypothetical protein
MLLDKYKGNTLTMKNKSSGSVDLSYHSDSGSKHSYYTNQSKLVDVKYSEIQDQIDKIFLFTLFTFNMEDIIDTKTILDNQKNLRLYVGNNVYKGIDFYFTYQPEGQ